jgi:hypothetical protein
VNSPLQEGRKTAGFPTPTNAVGVNANRRAPHKSGESAALQNRGAIGGGDAGVPDVRDYANREIGVPGLGGEASV